MINLLVDPGTSVSVVYMLGAILTLAIPVMFALIIARYRSFWPALFALPLMHGLFYFLMIWLETPLAGMGDFGLGMVDGINTGLTFFFGLHGFVIGLLEMPFGGNPTAVNIIEARWFAFVLYLVFFLIFFLIFNKNRALKKRKDIDEF